jgi:ABC-2 type transport system permease protein
MTKLLSNPSGLAPASGVAAPVARLRHRVDLSALGALFRLTLSQHGRAPRLLVFLFTLPSLIAILVRSFNRNPDVRLPSILEFGLILSFIPHLLVPLAALLYASGMIQDEIEEQTLTYLLIRPLPKWAIYGVKFLATLLITVTLAGVFILITYIAVFWGTAEFWEKIFPVRALKVAALAALTLVGYCPLFGWISLLFRRSLAAGVASIFLFEGLLANIDFAVRPITMMYYFRVLAERRLPVDWYAINRGG